MSPTETLFEGLTASEIEYLEYLRKQGYYDGFEMFLNLDTSSDYRVEKLCDGNYITLDDDGPYPGSRKVTITGKGVAALIDFEKYQNQIEPINSDIHALNVIAETLQRQVTLAEQNASDSASEAKSSKKLAIISLLIAAIPIIIQVISFLSTMDLPQ